MVQTKLSIVFILASAAPVDPQSWQSSYTSGSGSQNLPCVYVQRSVGDTISMISSLGITRMAL